MGKREEAKRMMKYYFGLIAKRAGVTWDSDNDVEIEAIIDLIIDASKE